MIPSFRFPLIALAILLSPGSVLGMFHAEPVGEPYWRFVVSIRIDIGDDYTTLCTGTLLRPNLALSIAHCFWPDKDGKPVPRYVQFYDASGHAVDSRAILNVRYLKDGDGAALVSFVGGLPAGYRTASIAPAAALKEGMPLVLVGAGDTETGRPEGLRALFSRLAFVYRGGFNARASVCAGDSGGPVFPQDMTGERPAIVGIINEAWRDYCVPHDVAILYSVPFFRTWIDHNVKVFEEGQDGHYGRGDQDVVDLLAENFRRIRQHVHVERSSMGLANEVGSSLRGR